MNEKTKPNYTARRIGALLGLGAVVGGGVMATERATDIVRSAHHSNQEYEKFSKPDLANNLVKNHILPTQVVVHYVQSGEGTPIAVATGLGANDIRLVASEIASQVGGEHSMQEGDGVVIPRDQLNDTHQLADK